MTLRVRRSLFAAFAPLVLACAAPAAPAAKPVVAPPVAAVAPVRGTVRLIFDLDPADLAGVRGPLLRGWLEHEMGEAITTSRCEEDPELVNVKLRDAEASRKLDELIESGRLVSAPCAVSEDRCVKMAPW